MQAKRPLRHSSAIQSRAYLVPHDGLRAFCSAVYRQLGVPPEDADIAADVLVEAELQGKEIQGVFFLERHARRIQRGLTNPSPRLQTLTKRTGVMLVDGDRGLGQVIATKAMRMAIDRASKTGIAVVGVRSSNDLTMAGYYAMQALQHDMIGCCVTSSAAVMPAFGGLNPIVSQGVLAWAVPAGKRPPILVDLSHAVVPIGKIRAAARDGRPVIPNGWVVDSKGNAVVKPERALQNPILVPIGGHKGSALALVADILSGILVGNPVGQLFPRDPVGQGSCGHLLYAIDVKAFAAVEEFKANVDRFISRIKRSKRARGITRIYVPGERAFECKARRLRSGIPIAAQTYHNLLNLKRELKVEALLADAEPGAT